MCSVLHTDRVRFLMSGDCVLAGLELICHLLLNAELDVGLVSADTKDVQM